MRVLIIKSSVHSFIFQLSKVKAILSFLLLIIVSVQGLFVCMCLLVFPVGLLFSLWSRFAVGTWILAGQFQRQGCILNLKLMRGCAGEKFSDFVVLFCKFLVNWGKKYAYFLPIGGKICIFYPFFTPFQSFFSPNMLFGHIPPLKVFEGKYSLLNIAIRTPPRISSAL